MRPRPSSGRIPERLKAPVDIERNEENIAFTELVRGLPCVDFPNTALTDLMPISCHPTIAMALTHLAAREPLHERLVSAMSSARIGLQNVLSGTDFSFLIIKLRAEL